MGCGRTPGGRGRRASTIHGTRRFFDLPRRHAKRRGRQESVRGPQKPAGRHEGDCDHPTLAATRRPPSIAGNHQCPQSVNSPFATPTKNVKRLLEDGLRRQPGYRDRPARRGRSRQAVSPQRGRALTLTLLAYPDTMPLAPDGPWHAVMARSGGVQETWLAANRCPFACSFCFRP